MDEKAVMRQLEHSEIINEKRVFPIVVFLDNWRTPENIGLAFRMCEAMGVEKLIISTSDHLYEIPNKVNKISRATVARVSHKIVNQSESNALLSFYKEKGYQLVAIEKTDESIDIINIEPRKTVLLLGAEREGIHKQNLDVCDISYCVKMYGLNSSLNVNQALSISLYQLTSKISLSHL